MLRATLIQFGIGYKVTRVLYDVTAEAARGFKADVIILNRRPVDDSYDDNLSKLTFLECLAHSTIRELHIPEE